MNLSQIREKYPEYSDLSDEDLARGLHRKHYTDMPWNDFKKAIEYVPGRVVEPKELEVEEPSFVKDVALQTAKDVAGVVAKVGAGLARGVTLGAVDLETGEVGIPFTDIKKRIAPPLAPSLERELDVSRETAESPWIGIPSEFLGVVVPWSIASRLVGTGINYLKALRVGKNIAKITEPVARARAVERTLGQAAARIGQQAITGGLVGAAHVREEDESLVKNIVTLAAAGAVLQTFGEGINVIATSTGLSRYGAYRRLKKDLTDLLYKNRKEPLTKGEVEDVADFMINKAARNAGVEKLTRKDFNQLRKRAKDVSSKIEKARAARGEPEVTPTPEEAAAQAGMQKEQFLKRIAADIADPAHPLTPAEVAFMGKSPQVQALGITQEELNAVALGAKGEEIATSVTEDMAISQDRALEAVREEMPEPAVEVEPIEVVEEVEVPKPKEKVEEPPVKEVEEIPTVKEIDKAAKEAETEPTEAQKEAGTYKKGHIKLYGFDISIENPKGSMRTAVDRKGREWSIELKHHYGYIRETKGKDKDHLDVFIGSKPESDKVFVVDQIVPDTGKFDEHKIMMGFETEKEARAGYLANYESGWKGLGNITEVTVDEFKEWIKTGDTTKAIGEIAKKPPPEAESKPPVEEKPTAVFKGWQEQAPPKPYLALYNVIGGRLDKSTVAAKTLEKEGIAIPETPEPSKIPSPEPKKLPSVKEKVEEPVEPRHIVAPLAKEGKGGNVLIRTKDKTVFESEKTHPLMISEFDRIKPIEINEIDSLGVRIPEGRIVWRNVNLEAFKIQLRDIRRAEPEVIEEVAPKEPTKPIPEVKEPKEAWEMSKKEYTEASLDKTWKKGMVVTKEWHEATDKKHKQAIQQAIKEGKIKSHPDYPELGKVEKPTPPEPKVEEVPEIEVKAKLAETKARQKRLRFAASQKHLVPWIAASGGVWDAGLKGEIKDIIYTQDAKGRYKPRKGVMTGFLNKNRGRTLDVVVRDAREAGFDVKDTDHLLELIEKDLAGALIGDIKGRVGKLTIEPTTQEEFEEGLIENAKRELRKEGLTDQEVERTLEEGRDVGRATPEDQLEENFARLEREAIQQETFLEEAPFELKPTEPPPKLRPREPKKVVIPTEKIPVVTKGEQVSLLPPRKGEQATIEGLIDLITDTLKDQRGFISYEKAKGPLYDNLLTLGRTFHDQGHTTYSSFKARMKAALSQVWDKIKYLMRRLYDDVKAKLREEAGFIAGVRAKGAPAGALAKAKRLLSKGLDEETVWKATGWMKGPAEGKWRFEIDDSGAKITDKIKELGIDSFSYIDGIQLKDFLNHPALFKAYPQLKTIDMKMELGELNLLSKGLQPGASYSKQKIEIRARTLTQAKHDLLHEIQHAIQEIEGFAPGGTPEMFPSTTMSQFPTKKDAQRFYNFLPLAAKRDARIMYNSWAEEYRVYIKKPSGYDPVAEYKRLAGEIEAREVAIRKELTPEERRVMLPYAAEGIPREDWIIKEGKGTSFSVEEKPPPRAPKTKEEQLAEEYIQKALGKVKETKVAELKPTEEITGSAYDKIVEQEAQKPIDQLIEEALNDERLVHHVRSTLKKAMSIGKKEGIAKQKGRYRQVVARAKARKEQIAKIRKMVDELKKIDVEKLSPQEAEPVRDLLAGLNLVKPIKKTIIRLTRTREYLEKDHDAEVPEYVMESLKRLDKRNIRDMSMEEIEAIHTAVMHYEHLNKVKNIIKVRREARRKAEVLADSIGEMKPPKQIKSDIVSSQKGKAGRLKKTTKLLKDTFGIRHDHYDLIIESLSGQNSTMDKVLYQDIKDGITEQLKYKQDTYAQFLKDVGDFSEKYGIKDISNWLNEEVTVGKFQFTRAERMTLLRHTLNTDNLRHLLAGGFGFRSIETPNKVYKISAKALNEVLQSLTPAEKHFAGTAVNNLFERQYEKLNKVFYQKNGYPLPKTKDPYYPIEVMPITLGTDLETVDALEKFKGIWTRIGLEKGMLEKRVKSRKPIYLNSIVFDINRSVMKSAAYIGLEMPLSNASKLLYDQTFRAHLEDRYGKQTWREIEKGLRDIAGDYQSYTTVEEMVLKLKNNLTVAMLGINPFVMTKQVLSLPVYLPYVKLEYLVQGMIDFAVHPIEVGERHKMYSPEYLERVEGGYSRDVADVFKGAALKRLYKGKGSIKEKFMGGIQLFDRVAVSAGMQGGVLQVLDEFDQGTLSREVRIALDMKDTDIAKLTPAEKMRLAYKFADYATERTQPMFSPEHRSSLSRGAAIEKIATMFGAFTNTALGLMRRTYREALRTGEPAAYAKLAKVLFLILVVNPLGVMAIDEIRNRLYRRKDRPSIAGRILNTWAGYMFFVRDLANSVISKVEKGTFLGYDVQLPVQRIPELLSNVFANGVKMMSDKTPAKRKKAAVRFVDDSLNLILTMQGIPYQTPKKMILGAVKPKESKAVHY